MSSTDQVPEVSGEESALVPPAPKPEWPKKIRTLTAGELDRLTIDSEGRFYWDGRLVKYQPPKSSAPEVKPEKPVDPFDRVAQDILDSAAIEMGRPRSPDAPPAPAINVSGSESDSTTDVPIERARAADALAPVGAVAIATAEPGRAAVATPITLAYPAHTERTRLLLSFWQSLGLLITVVALLLGAAGIAAQGFVTVQEWGCKVGWAKATCPAPPPPAPAPPPRPELPL
jgi:hypothetical protein